MPDSRTDRIEMATTEAWRVAMRAARKATGITQGQLAARVGTSQALISGIESGEVSASSSVPAICAALGIPPPQVLVRDDIDQRWIEAGRMLRLAQPDLHETQLEAFESMIKRLKGSGGGR